MKNRVKNHSKIADAFLNTFLTILVFLGLIQVSTAQVNLGGVNHGNLPNYHIENNAAIDNGLNPFASIGNFVWYDKNRNGIQDPTEEGIANVIVVIGCSGNFVTTTITNLDGKYKFNNLAPGQYYLAFTLPNSDYAFSAKNSTPNNDIDGDVNPSSGITGCITLTAGNYYMKADAGMFLMEDMPNTTNNNSSLRKKNNENDLLSDNLAPHEVKASSYPNPFVTSTTLEFESSQDSPVGSVEIYSLSGSKITSLFNDKIEANTIYKVKWEPSNVSNGVYIYKIVCGEKVITGRLMLTN